MRLSAGQKIRQCWNNLRVVHPSEMGNNVQLMHLFTLLKLL